MDEQKFQEILDEGVQRMLAGETWQQAVAAFPAHAADLAPALQGAYALLRAQAPRPAPAARAAAMQQMMATVATAGAASHSTKGGGVVGWISWFKMRPPAARFAAAGMAAVIFGGLGMGAAAATGNAPEPVRSFFGVSESVISVEFKGSVVSFAGSTLEVDANGDIRTVILGTNTRLTRDGETLVWSDFMPGEIIEVKGTLRADNAVLATLVKLEDSADNGTLTPVADGTQTVPTAITTADDGDDSDNGCDNSGPGSPCDDDGDDDASKTPGAQPTQDDGDDECDNSGSGSPCDDDDADATKTPGADSTQDDADDSDDRDDSSGDDSSGSGSGGSGGGDDEPDGSDSSGPGGGD